MMDPSCVLMKLAQYIQDSNKRSIVIHGFKVLVRTHHPKITIFKKVVNPSKYKRSYALPASTIRSHVICLCLFLISLIHTNCLHLLFICSLVYFRLSLIGCAKRIPIEGPKVPSRYLYTHLSKIKSNNL